MKSHFGTDSRVSAPAPGRGASPEGGFALVGVLLALLLLTLLAAAGFLLSSAERAASEAHRDAVDAFLAAEAGLEGLMAATVGLPPDRTVAGLAGRPATVTTLRLTRAPGGEPLFLLRSERKGETRQRAHREVERLALLVPLLGPPPAALTSGGPVSGGEGGARVSGFDGAGPETCRWPAGDVAGLAVPPGGADALAQAAVLEGSPGLLESPAPGSAAFGGGSTSVARLVGLADSAQGIRAVPGGAVLGPEASGSGLLVAVGDLVLEDGFRWDGVVIAGGNLTLRGGPVVRGATFGAVGTLPAGGTRDVGVELGTGGAEIRYDRCLAAAARLAASRLRSLRGSWREVF